MCTITNAVLMLERAKMNHVPSTSFCGKNNVRKPCAAAMWSTFFVDMSTSRHGLLERDKNLSAGAAFIGRHRCLGPTLSMEFGRDPQTYQEIVNTH